MLMFFTKDANRSQDFSETPAPVLNLAGWHDAHL